MLPIVDMWGFWDHTLDTWWTQRHPEEWLSDHEPILHVLSTWLRGKSKKGLEEVSLDAKSPCDRIWKREPREWATSGKWSRGKTIAMNQMGSKGLIWLGGPGLGGRGYEGGSSRTAPGAIPLYVTSSTFETTWVALNVWHRSSWVRTIHWHQ